ncbi:interleukin 12 receptor, beta 2a, like [Aulostomus maculatus]
MATLASGWLLSILLVNLPKCITATGPLAPPFNIKCHMPCDEDSYGVNIHCVWDHILDLQIPTNYSLHWETTDSKESHVTTGTNMNGSIHREHFSSHSELRVWVQAENQYGSAKSEEIVFNTGDIIMPPPPQITSSYLEPLEINWNHPCNLLHLCFGPCVVQYRSEGDQDWFEVEIGSRISYEVNGPVQPGIVYEFRVRCACCTGLMSDWSAIHKIKSSETTPVGQLDVWRDCGISPTSLNCVMIWKKLPISQACGHILGYEVRLSHHNGTAVLINVSAAELLGRLVCHETQCYLNFTLKGVSSANISAYNSRGATVPAHVAFPTPGNEQDGGAIQIKVNTENLTVSWSQLPDSLTYKEYVVQYKQIGRPLGQGFDWTRVRKKQSETFKGQFQKYTPYQVSMFTVLGNNTSRCLSSAIGYSLQGPPSKVRSFKVYSIAATHVTLFWEPVPLSMQNGVILFYQIGVNRKNVVYNVNASQQQENKTFELLHLSPGQEYEVWINAVTVAGPGANTTIRLKTKHPEHLGYLIKILPPACLVLIIYCLVFLFRFCQGKSKTCPLVPQCFFEKVPDPHNSYIFRQMKHQMNDPLSWICTPIFEPHPKISVLEIIEVDESSHPEGPTRPMVKDRRSQIDCQHNEGEDAVIQERDRTGFKEAYSRMVDSDEDSCCSSEEEQLTSGYEKHFMPTALEILGV